MTSDAPGDLRPRLGHPRLLGRWLAHPVLVQLLIELGLLVLQRALEVIVSSTSPPDTARHDATSTPPHFALGRLVATPQALAILQQAGIAPLALFQRHVQGDWGDLCPADAEANETALRQGGRLLSGYRLGTGLQVWILTAADRSVTTLLHPEAS